MKKYITETKMLFTKIIRENLTIQNTVRYDNWGVFDKVSECDIGCYSKMCILYQDLTLRLKENTGK